MITLEPAALLGAIIVYTASIASLVLWLEGRFRRMESVFRRELNGLNRQMAVHGLKIQRLELRIFGFTMAPSTELENGATPSEGQQTQS